MTFSSLRNASAVSLFILGTCLTSASGQQSAPSQLPAARPVLVATSESTAVEPLPDGPSYSSSLATAADPQTASQPTAAPNQEHVDGQTKRILGIIPNFRAVSANAKLPPQTTKDKFADFFQDSFDYSSVFVPALLAGYNQARNETPEFRQGGVGYSRYLWHSFVDQTDENLWVEFLIPVVAHEDTRYYTLGSGGFKKRAGYAIKHVVICRDDAGKDVFNSGEILGAGISAGLSNLYYPSNERTVGNTLSQYGISVGIDAFTFAFKEFWPDINHKLFHGSKPYAD